MGFGEKEQILSFEKSPAAGRPNCDFRPFAGRPKQEIVRKKRESGQWTVVSGQWKVVNRQWSVVSGQWTVNSGQ